MQSPTLYQFPHPPAGPSPGSSLGSSTGVPSGTAPLKGYDRAAVEEYLAVATAERDRLRAALADARARVARARAALDARRVLAVMLEEACDEIAAKRRQAELVAGRIAAGADPDGAIRWRAPGASSPRLEEAGSR